MNAQDTAFNGVPDVLWNAMVEHIVAKVLPNFGWMPDHRKISTHEYSDCAAKNASYKPQLVHVEVPSTPCVIKRQPIRRSAINRNLFMGIHRRSIISTRTFSELIGITIHLFELDIILQFSVYAINFWISPKTTFFLCI